MGCWYRRIAKQHGKLFPFITNTQAYKCCRNFGEFWLLKLVLSELQRDLQHRLSVYAQGKSAAEKPDKLLLNSQLWRMLEV